jgi:hypothetical protein
VAAGEEQADGYVELVMNYELGIMNDELGIMKLPAGRQVMNYELGIMVNA